MKLELFLRSLDRKQVEAAAINLCFVGGLVLVAVGVGLFSAAAGVIFAGLSVVACVILYVRGTSERPSP